MHERLARYVTQTTKSRKISFQTEFFGETIHTCIFRMLGETIDNTLKTDFRQHLNLLVRYFCCVINYILLLCLRLNPSVMNSF